MLSSLRSLSRGVLANSLEKSFQTFQMERAIRIDITSDTVCPWCYVGKRRLEKALARVGKDKFEVNWLPFFLAPNAPLEGRPKLQVYNEKFGPARVAQMVPYMKEVYASEGLGNYSLEGLTGNTRSSHRLILWARHKGGPQAQDKVVEHLMQGYFTGSRYIGDVDFLVEAAQAAGLDAGEARAVLEDPRAYEEELQAELGLYSGISGVPHFAVDGDVHLNGAQPPEVMEAALRKVLARHAHQALAPGDKAGTEGAAVACGRDGVGCA